MSIDESGNATYKNNDSELFEFSFYIEKHQITEDGEITNYTVVDALDCKEVVEKYVTNEYAKQQILNEFENNSQFLCPDLPSFQLYMQTWFTSDGSSYEYLSINVKAKPETTNQ